MIIGITGQPASGKDTVAEYLVSKGFVNISTGNIIREQMREDGLPTDRETMNKFVKAKRAELGNHYPGEEALKKLKERSILSGFRNTTEVTYFRGKLGNQFVLVAVEAPIEKRYEWASKGRGREGDNITFEEFKRQEDQERPASSGSHEVDAVIEMADHLIVNDGTKEDLLRKVDGLLEQLENRELKNRNK